MDRYIKGHKVLGLKANLCMGFVPRGLFRGAGEVRGELNICT